MIDLRSDTLTHPTDNMRRAMAAAEVGDDVFGEDPTIRRLEEMAAERMGKEAALFVASGTMANLISQMVHCRRGDEMLVGDQAHIFFYEQGGSAAIGGIHPRSVPNQSDGTMLFSDLEERVRPDDAHFPRSRLIALENTHNRCSGSPLAPEYIQSVVEFARRHQLKVHMDGARIFNAAVALKVAPHRLTHGVDSVSFCLSKGLAAPVGSLVCGSAAFIAEARRVRKVLGGGMRQAGVLAAAGIVALTEMVERLSDDHANAQVLARRLAELPGLEVDPARIKTNIVYVRLMRADMDALEFARRLGVAGVKVLAAAKDKIRAVTHYMVDRPDMEKAATIFAETWAQR
jgi:threonine aldolase